jgi:hypothetical protein
MKYKDDSKSKVNIRYLCDVDVSFNTNYSLLTKTNPRQNEYAPNICHEVMSS